MRIGAWVGVGLLVVALAGCAPEDPRVQPPPTPTVEPLFASDEEALAAAEEAYAAYLAMSDEITGDGGANPDRIVPFVTSDRLAEELDGFKVFSDNGLHTVGRTLFEPLGLQRTDLVEVVFYACWDASAIQLLDVHSQDATPSNRPDRLKMEVVLEAIDGGLVLESADPWSDPSC